MTAPFTREQILGRLRQCVANGRPILVATAGNGLIARSLEAGGVDLLLTSVTGVARQRGLPSIGWRMTENNEVVLAIVGELSEVVHDTPLIASVGVGEFPADADLGAAVDTFAEAGYSGLLNYPTSGVVEAKRQDEQYAEFAARAARPGASDFERRNAIAVRQLRAEHEERARTGRGYPRELQLVRAASDRGVFTLGYAWTTEQAHAMVQAGADVIIGHCGGTAGGAAGAPTQTAEEAAQWLQEIFSAARQANHEVLLLGHGGPFSSPQSTHLLYRLTSANGFLSGSAVERIPVERAVTQAVLEFKAVPVRTDQEQKERDVR